MAGEITHAVFAHKYYDQYFDKFEPAEFYVGTLFPDVRHIASNTERELTHLEPATLHNVLAQSDAFMAGQIFHSVIDNYRTAFILANHIYEHAPEVKWISRIIKMYEDDIFYKRINKNGWRRIIKYLETPPQSHDLIPQTTIDKWYALLQEYFAQPPTNESRKNILTGVDMVDEAGVQHINRYVNQLRDNEKVTQIVQDMYTFLPLDI